jgi:hypothetical protein
LKFGKHLNQPHVLIDLSNPIFSREGYLQQHWQKNFTSPWKQALSPVACAQPDKYVSGCEPTSDLRNFKNGNCKKDPGKKSCSCKEGSTRQKTRS